MEQIKIVLVADDKQIRNRLAAAINSEFITLVESLAPSSSLLSTLTSLSFDCIVLYNDNSDWLLELTERIYVTKTGCPILMVCPDLSTNVVRRAMESGATRTIGYEGEETKLDETILYTVSREKNRLAPQTEQNSTAAEVVSIFGTKGGTGKTMLAVNLAAALAACGKKVALVDLDLQFGDVGILLDIAKSDNVADVVEEKAFDFGTLKSYLYLHSSGINVLCAPSSPEYAEMVAPDHITKIVNGLKYNFDYVLLDMPPAFTDCSIAGLESSSRIYFVLNPDISTLRNTKVSLGVMESLSLSDRIELVLNKNGCSTIKPGDIEKILERKILLLISNDAKCAIQAVNRGIPIVIGEPRSKIASEILGFVSRQISKSDKKIGFLRSKVKR